MKGMRYYYHDYYRGPGIFELSLLRMLLPYAAFSFDAYKMGRLKYT